jgi:hypothetical protein
VNNKKQYPLFLCFQPYAKPVTEPAEVYTPTPHKRPSKGKVVIKAEVEEKVIKQEIKQEKVVKQEIKQKKEKPQGLAMPKDLLEELLGSPLSSPDRASYSPLSSPEPTPMPMPAGITLPKRPRAATSSEAGTPAKAPRNLTEPETPSKPKPTAPATRRKKRRW